MFFRKKDNDNIKAKYADRLPPGQSVTLKWPVLHLGSEPNFNPNTWDFYLYGAVKSPKRFTWDEFSALPTKEQISDMHCVTRWSKFDSRFEGVPVQEVMKHIELLPEASHVMVHTTNGYTTNLSLEDFLDDDVMFVTKYEGEVLTQEHGYPMRLLVPKLYLWKSAKWVNGLEFLTEDKPGFWEKNGYHMRGEPFKEERYGSYEVNTMQSIRSKRS